MRKFLTYVLAASAFFSASCSHDDGPETPAETPGIPTGRTFFAKGADISWITEMEADGMKFYDAAGKESECTAVLKEAGVNSIRLRVWVDPEEGWCSKEDVLVKASRAQALGMKIMIDFHYSDTWADPGSQKTPAAWAGYDVQKLEEAVGMHTEDVLKTLKDNGIDIEWVQVGNELDSGMLHPAGNIGNPGNIPAFAAFVNAGSKAVRKIYSDAKVILHRSNGHETDGFTWFLNVLQAQKADYDMIGMSLYPTWWENGANTPWETNTRLCLDNIRTMSVTYGKPVMICEFGMPASEPEKAREALEYILEQAADIRQLHGVFYWEPQVYGGWKPSGYAELGWSGYDKGAFSNGRPTAALGPFSETIL